MPTPTIDPSDLKEIAPHLWMKAQQIKTRQRFVRGNWFLTDTQKDHLAKSSSLKELAERNSLYATPYLRNIYLREGIANILKDPNASSATKVQLFDWIVRDWGGIQSHKKDTWIPKLKNWLKILDDFSPANVQALIDDRKTWNISSWSKVLAFADYKSYAVYDARVAVAINVLLHEIGSDYVFYMPPTQNKNLHGAATALGFYARQKHPHKRDIYLRYNSYLQLLGAICEHSGAKDILDVEIHLFSIAPKVSRVFWRCRKHELSEDLVKGAEEIIAKGIDDDE